MTLSIIFHEHAEIELNEAAAYYAEIRLGLGEAFIAAVQSAVDELVTFPLIGQAVEDDVRWWLVRRFPYNVFYQVCADHIRILAIGHQKRRPFYWRSRR